MKQAKYNIADNLPESLNRKNIIELARVIDKRLHELEGDIKCTLIYPRIDELDSDLIDELAIQLHVDFYDTTLPLAKRRALVKNSIRWHMKKGTKAAVMEVVTAVFGSARVEEWFEYDGEPYHFRVYTGGAFNGTSQKEEIIKAIDSVKNVRSWLDGIRFYLDFIDDETVEDTELTFGAGVGFEENFPFAKRLYGEGYDYDGSVFYGGNVDAIEYGVKTALETRYAVAQIPYGKGRTYGDAGEPYGGTAGPADYGGAFVARRGILYGESHSYGDSGVTYGVEKLEEVI